MTHLHRTLRSPGRSLGPLLCLALLLQAAPVHAARPPDPDQARALVLEVVTAVQGGAVDETRIRGWFGLPPGVLGEVEAAVQVDQERLASALGPGGPLARALSGAPAVAATVVGPDYVRVVLDTTPALSFLVRREGGRATIERWETTTCAACREPLRFVSDLLWDLQSGRRHRLVPGLDLRVSAPEGLEGEAEFRWRVAFQARNQAAGYLRDALAGAAVLDMGLDEVRVELGDRVEGWPVVYRDRRWALDYGRLPPDSVLRLLPEDVDRWRDEDHLARAALAAWRPLDVPTGDGGRLLGERVVGVGWDPQREAWLLVLQRQDRRLAALVALEDDGTVLERVQVPGWPEGLPVPVQTWGAAWAFATEPGGRRVLVAGAGRWWIVDRGDGRAVEGARGVLDEVAVAAWSEAGPVVGDARGNLALLDPETGLPVQVRYTGASHGAVRGLVPLPGRARLVAAWADGHVGVLALPGLEERVGTGGHCCGAVTGLAVIPGRDEVLLGCERACDPVVATRLWLDGHDPPEGVADSVLDGGGVVSASPDGAWVVLPGSRRGAVLCRGGDLAPVRAFGDLPLVQVIWDGGSSAFLGLRIDGRVVRWRLEDLLAEVAPTVRGQQPPS